MMIMYRKTLTKNGHNQINYSIFHAHQPNTHLLITFQTLSKGDMTWCTEEEARGLLLTVVDLHISVSAAKRVFYERNENSANI